MKNNKFFALSINTVFNLTAELHNLKNGYAFLFKNFGAIFLQKGDIDENFEKKQIDESIIRNTNLLEKRLTLLGQNNFCIWAENELKKKQIDPCGIWHLIETKKLNESNISFQPLAKELLKSFQFYKEYDDLKNQTSINITEEKRYQIIDELREKVTNSPKKRLKC